MSQPTISAMPVSAQRRHSWWRIALAGTGAVIALVLLVSLSAGGAAAASSPPAMPDFVPGRLLLQARAGLGTAAIDQALAPQGGKGVGRIEAIDVHIVQLPPGADTMAVAR